MAAFAASGLPHRRVEAYHYTDLRNLLREAAPLAPSALREGGRGVSRPAAFMGDLGAHEIIIVNGRLMDAVEPRLATAQGVTIATTGDTAPTILDAKRCRGRAEHGPCARDRHARDRQTASRSSDPCMSPSFRMRARRRPCSRGFDVRVGKGASVTLLETHEGPNGIATQSNHRGRDRDRRRRERRACSGQCRGRQGLVALEPWTVARAWSLGAQRQFHPGGPCFRVTRSSLALHGEEAKLKLERRRHARWRPPCGCDARRRSCRAGRPKPRAVQDGGR